MALETLKDVKEIGGFRTYHVKEIGGFRTYHVKDPSDIVPEEFTACSVIINDRTNTIAFTLQNGPIKEVGVNGCQVDTMIEVAKMIIEGFDKQFPCEESAQAIVALHEALLWLEKRKANREERGVEGTSQP